MPLFDHFRPPVYDHHGWESFHAGWAVEIVRSLNATLPERFIAEAPVHLGPDVSADVGELESGRWADSGGVALYRPAAATLTMPLDFPPEFAVEIRDRTRTRLLVAVIEIVSPSNKDRPRSREVFAAKAAGYLQAGCGLVVADIVSTFRFNLHNELIRLAGLSDALRMPADDATYIAAYRPFSNKGENSAAVWAFPLRIGDTLPTVPLALRGYGCVELNLEAAYAAACAVSRIR